VFVDGEVFEVDIRDADSRRAEASSRRSLRRGGPESLSAPMPATVARMLVSVDQAVKRGETLVLLEAMRMELPLRAPHDAVVKGVHCAVGDLVQPGVALIDLG
jgi:biotin carboxyl carrier protein